MLSRNRVAAGLLLPAGLIWILLALHSLSTGGVTWDEMFDFEGVNGAFWHGINWLKGAHPDLHTITFDLEWFGNATRWPTYLLWRLLMTLPWEQITSLSRNQIVLGSGYVGLNHLNAMVFALAGIGLSTALAWRLGGEAGGPTGGWAPAAAAHLDGPRLDELQGHPDGRQLPHLHPRQYVSVGR